MQQIDTQEGKKPKTMQTTELKQQKQTKSFSSNTKKRTTHFSKEGNNHQKKHKPNNPQSRGPLLFFN